MPRFRGAPSWGLACLAVLDAAAEAQVRWQRPEGISRLDPRVDYALAHDPARGRTILFGGQSRAGSLNDTWEWDGTSWTQRFPVRAPSPRAGHRMVHDPGRGRILLFGGELRQDTTTTPLGDTWEWDGANWTRLLFFASPSPRHGHAMAYDVARARVMLFGGRDASTIFGDLWECDGTTWTRLMPAASPSPRYGHGLACDAARARVVLFGGRDASMTLLGDTWEWNGTGWTALAPVTRPPARRGPGMVFDEARGRVFLYGGSSLALDPDCWEWNGTDWTRHTLPDGPSARSGIDLAHDRARGRTVLFSGERLAIPWTSTYGRPSDTWEWDGQVWMQRVPWTQPLGRSGTAAAYDPVRQRLVLFGGIDGNQLSNETWEWDGSQWSLRPTALAPPARAGHAMAWDGTRGRIVVHGGSGYLNDQWEWDGTGWSLVSVSGVIPPGRNAHSLAYDSRRRRLVLFGGYTGTGYPPHDTWEWDGTSWTRQTPAASPSGPTGPMAYDEGRGVTALWVDLWSVLYEWDGANWTRPTPPTQPPYQRLTSYSNLAYDPLRRRIGLYRSTLARMFEHWEWDGMLWVERHDPGLPYAHPPLLIHDAGRSRSVLLAMTHPEAWELQIPWDTVGPGHPLGGGPIVTPSDVARPGDRQCFTVTLPSPQRAGFHLLLVAAGTGLHPAVVLTPPGACSPGLLHLAPHAILAAQGEPGFFCWSLPPSPGLVGQTFVVQALSMVVGGCFYLSDALGFVIQPGPFPSRP